MKSFKKIAAIFLFCLAKFIPFCIAQGSGTSILTGISSVTSTVHNHYSPAVRVAGKTTGANLMIQYNTDGNTFFSSIDVKPFLDQAMTTWGSLLGSCGSSVNVFFKAAHLGSGASHLMGTSLNYQVSTPSCGWTGVVLENYPQSLADFLYSLNVSGGGANNFGYNGANTGITEANSDFIITVNIDGAWSPTATPAPGTFDLLTAVLHEMGHGLGFWSATVASGSGVVVPGDILFIYDNFIDDNGTGTDYTACPGALTNITLEYAEGSFPTPTFTSYCIGVGLYDGPDCSVSCPAGPLNPPCTDLYFEIPGGSTGSIQLYVPTIWMQGKSIGHLFEVDNPGPADNNELMQPNQLAGGQLAPSATDASILSTIGWGLTHIAF